MRLNYGLCYVVETGMEEDNWHESQLPAAPRAAALKEWI